jgi:hypothetical protein
VPSAKAASLLADLAGISLTAMRAERAAEAAGAATLHCQEASGRWEEIWQRPHNQTPGADLHHTGKLILLPTKLAHTRR